MSQSGTIRRGSARRPAARGRKVQRKPPLLDRIIATLPISQETLHRIVSWSLFAAMLAALIAIASWFGVPAAIGAGLAEAAGDAGFRVEKVEVTGLKRMDRMSVYAIALDQKSRAMPSVDLESVRDKLMRYGWVEDAQVSRRLPDTLLVNIVERTPAAVWQDHGSLTLIDEAGVPLEPVRADAMPDLPVVIGPDANQQMAGYRALLDHVPAFRGLVKAATWVGNRRWDLTFATGETLRLPEGDQPATHALAKFAELDKAQPLLGKGWLGFDMRDPTRLVARKPGAEQRQAITGAAATLPANTITTPAGAAGKDRG